MPMKFIEAPTNFYLGAGVDPGTGKVIEDDIIYYDSRDLMTHGVILGMTGSGKTGLGITLLEEAALDNIPTLIIDPKGDITNMLLAFPDLSAESFKPWVNPEDAVRGDATLDEHAAAVAEKWKAGLEEWGITNKRIQDYRRSARFSIYTPGSSAGLQVSILQSLAAPRMDWDVHHEVLRERISGTVTAILALIGINAKPVEDKEHILLSNIFEHNWRNNADLSMEQLIVQVQRPPFTRLGAMDIETVFKEKARFKLAQKLNNIIAAPNFQSWLQGEALDIRKMLYTPEGNPRVTILYIAHLNDSERQFILTLLLENILTWMRSLPGSSSLRALIYIDEVYGMFPPHPHNPPTKDPIMRLLKQGRAFGIGTVVATQNPKDIDYKGLSNAGTWFIGKLQTDNDKERVLEGLDSARDATSALDIKEVEKLLGQLGPRQFIMHNVHETNTPRLMSTRWAMSYLRGPLTRQHISQLMANQRHLAASAGAVSQPSHQAPSGGMGVGAPMAAAPPQMNYPPPGSGASLQPGSSTPTSSSPAPAPKEAPPPPGFVAIQPILPSSTYQYYLPMEYTVEQSVRNWESWMQQPAVQVDTKQRLLYRPALLAQANVRFDHKKTGTSAMWTYAFVVPTLPRTPYLNWNEYISDPFDPTTLDPDPFAEAFYAELPSVLASGSGFKDLKANLTEYIYQEAAIYIYHNPILKVHSGIDEDKRDFYARVQAVARELRDAEVDKVASSYDNKLERLEERARKKGAMTENREEDLDARKREEMITAGESAMQLLKGNARYMLSRTSRMRRYTNRSEDQYKTSQRDLQSIMEDLDETEKDMEQALQAVQSKWSENVRQVEELRISPYKKDIHMVLFGIGWVPYWEATINGSTVILPASSSGLSYAQG